MANLTKTFIVTKGGAGINDVTSFIDRELGRDATLVKSLSAASINDTTTYLTLEYLSSPAVSIEVTNPINGLVTSTVSPPLQFHAQYSQPIDVSTYNGSSVRFSKNGVATTGSALVESNMANYIVAYKLDGYLTGSGSGNSGSYTLLFDKSVQTSDGSDQISNSLFGFNIAREASPYIGLENLYTHNIKRGKMLMKYAILDTSVFADKKIKTVLKSLTVGGELLAQTTAQKGSYTEVFSLILDQPEPIPDAVYPRLGAMSQPNAGLNKVTITYRNPVRTAQIAEESVYAITRSWNSQLAIDPIYVSVIDNKTIEIDIKSLIADEHITNNYIDLMCMPGLYSSNEVGGIDATRPYLLPFTTYISEVVVGTGVSGVTGPQGPQGPAGPSGAGFSGNAPLTDNAILRWDGTAGTTVQGSSTNLSDAGALGLGSNLTITGNTMTLGAGGTQGVLNIGSDPILRVSTAGQTLLKATTSINLQSGATTRVKMDCTDGTFYPNVSQVGTLGKGTNEWGALYVADTYASNSINYLGYKQPRFSFGPTMPVPSISGDMHYSTTDNELYYYDWGRTKWLSLSIISLSAGSTGSPGAAHYLSFNQCGTAATDNGSSDGFGYVVPYAATIVGASICSQNAPGTTSTLSLKGYDGTDILSPALTLSGTNIAYSTSLNTDIAESDRILFYINPGGDPISPLEAFILIRKTRS
jgi:hypothetical protein